MDRCLEIMGSRLEQLGQPTLNWVLAFVRATRAQIAGDPDRAEQLATEALQIGTDSGEPDAAMIFGAQLALVSYQRGTMGELVPLIKEAAADNPGSSCFRRRLWPWPTPKVTAPTTLVNCWRSSRPPDSISRWIRLAHRHDCVQRCRHRMPGS